MKREVLPVLLSGGAGTRLWPASRELHPKQLLPLLTEHSLLQQTALRLKALEYCDDDIAIKSPLVICNEAHRFIVAEQLRQIKIDATAILLEPVGRNTAPALTVASLWLKRISATDPILLVLPADHVILDQNAFKSAVVDAVEFASRSHIVTFGIVPNRPETGYGYIKKDKLLDQTRAASTIENFVEKPDLETATCYMRDQNYFWNSGMFVCKSSVWLQNIGRYKPEIVDACANSVDAGRNDMDFFRLDHNSFEACVSDSIDYAVMEPLTEDPQNSLPAVVVPLDAGWSDVGSWDSLWEIHQKDINGNATRGDTELIDCNNNLVIAEHRFVAAIGLQDVLVVETADAVLVADKSQAQKVKKIVELLKQKQRSEAVSHRKVYRPWGSYEGVDAGNRFQVKRIIVNPGASLSLQMHHHRAEHWVVVRGTARIVRGDEEFLLSENQSTYIPLGVLHRLANPGTIPLEIIEIQSGAYLGEDDIVRFADDYGRRASDKPNKS